MLRALRNKKGVTLVELLAVVVILGIIAAIAVPTIGGLIARQQEKADVATLQNVVDSAKLYALAEEDNEFLLSALDSEYIDLSDYKFGLTESKVGGTSDAIWVKVDGSDVTFYTDDPSGTGVVDDTIFVNDTQVTVSTMKAV